MMTYYYLKYVFSIKNYLITYIGLFVFELNFTVVWKLFARVNVHVNHHVLAP